MSHFGRPGPLRCPNGKHFSNISLKIGKNTQVPPGVFLKIWISVKDYVFDINSSFWSDPDMDVSILVVPKTQIFRCFLLIYLIFAK